MKEKYEDKRFQKNTLRMIEICDEIVEDYASQGYRLTLRQIYYQLVARGHIENTIQSYANVGTVLMNARLAGLIDWDAVEDRTREVVERAHWSSGSQILNAVAEQYHEDMWSAQCSRPIVIVEKEALAGILERTCHEWDVPLLAARGYPSVTTLRELAKNRIMRASQHIVLLHLGDHDPSGMDMSRDLIDRLGLFTRYRVKFDFRRLALNMDQIEAENPPPNPAKVTDSRYESYRKKYGEESWELDALSPAYIHKLVSREIRTLIDFNAWDETKRKIDDIKARLADIAATFDEE